MVNRVSHTWCRRGKVLAAAATLTLLGWGAEECLAFQNSTLLSGQVTVMGGRMSGHLNGVPLGDVLKELSRQLSIPISVDPPVAHDLVTVTFRDVPLDEGIHRILEGKEYALIHRVAPISSREDSPGNIGRILVFSSSREGSAVSQVPMAVSGETTERAFEKFKRRVLEAEDPDDRILALGEVVDRGAGLRCR